MLLFLRAVAILANCNLSSSLPHTSSFAREGIAKGSSKVAVNAVEKETPLIPSTTTEEPSAEAQSTTTTGASTGSDEVNSGNSVPTSPKDIPFPLSPITTTPGSHAPVQAPSKSRRFSFRNFAAPRHDRNEPKRSLSAVEEHEKRVEATAALSKRKAKPLLLTSDRRAEESALMVRDLIVGPTTASPSITKAVARPQMSKLKSQLMKPKSANKVIRHLRTLPAEGANAENAKATGPIHAVCLAHTDEEENTLHFDKLSKSDNQQGNSTSDSGSTAVESLSALFSEMNIIDLIYSPDFGLGQPGDGKGFLAGAVPTAETVLKGVEQVTPQLMALGYATGKAIIPDHTGIHPPTDHWWGLELVMPPPTLSVLKSAHSVSGTAVNFLSALALVNNGVREILPFIRYMAQFLDFEFKNIEAQDQGSGVVCAATWIMPAAMVPRPWDFTPPTEILLPPNPPPEGLSNAPVDEGKSNEDKPDLGEEAPGQSPPESSPDNEAPAPPEVPDSGATPSPVISPIPVMTPLAAVANA
ncbi:hypothetical protein D9758_006849 [Tetrapyrgos nigripes]|uniref:Uncharacterized protein n=1 Tax=Tetrapyrgos nigripes TaxID=182062 RepID=A0A8H5CV86_9AGAR|nr:hypothetical protein D9758_006849 [Tetrapyrgos nigripes]